MAAALTSPDLSARLTRLPAVSFEKAVPRGVPRIIVDERQVYQRITGFGAAMTDSSAWLLRDELAPDDRRQLLQKLFGAGGIRLGFVRVPMAASDFTRTGVPYSYDDLAPGLTDPLMRRFSVAHDRAYVVPALREVRAANPGVEVLSNPWSPPTWMKLNGSLDNRANGGALIRGSYPALARYFVDFIRAYSRLGIPIDALTPQNEPSNPTPYPGLALSSAEESLFIHRFLAPALRQARLHTHVYGNDSGWSRRSSAYATALARGSARGDLAGIAWHCYFGSPGVMGSLHRLGPELDQIVDECSPGITPFAVSELVISALRNWASVVALWNLALDPAGGPVEPPNHGCPGCTGIATIDEATHAATLNQAYYELGQASSFVQRGAMRIASSHFVHYGYGRSGKIASPGLDDVALENPDGSIVLMTYDNSQAPASFAVAWHGRYLRSSLEPGDTMTLVWNRPPG